MLIENMLLIPFLSTHNHRRCAPMGTLFHIVAVLPLSFCPSPILTLGDLVWYTEEYTNI